MTHPTSRQPHPTDILALPLGANDAEARTVRDFLTSLLFKVWYEEDNFSGKRAFGSGGWKNAVYRAFMDAGWVDGTFDEDGGIEIVDHEACELLIFSAISYLRFPS